MNGLSIEIIGLLVTFLLGLFVLIGAFVALLASKKEQITDFCLGLAFSVIIMLIVLDLIPEVCEHLGLAYIWLALLFIALGYGILRLLDRFVPDHHEHHKMTKKESHNNLRHIGILSSVALIIHNIVEGMAVYTTVLTSVSSGLLLAIGIGFHNLPLGMVIATAFYQGDQKPFKTWLSIGLVAASTLLGGVLGFALSSVTIPEWVLGGLLSITLGMLLFILFSELWHRIYQSKYKKERNIGIILGIVVMIISMLI